MSASIECLHMNHVNVMVEGFDESVDHFQDLYGAQVILDMAKGEEWHACLITIGTVLFELFAPNSFLLHARSGPHYIGIEYQVPDTAEARTVVQTRGMRIIRDIGVAIHTHPADSIGVAIELYDRNFHDEPPPIPYLEPIKPLEYWRDEHPLGCTGLRRYSIAVSHLSAATTFLQDFTNATVIYEEARPDAGARAVGLQVADTVVELLTATADGPVQRDLDRHGDGIRSTVFAVRSLGQAESYFRTRGITLRPGDAPNTLAIAPRDNRGLLFEFSE